MSSRRRDNDSGVPQLPPIKASSARRHGERVTGASFESTGAVPKAKTPKPRTGRDSATELLDQYRDWRPESRGLDVEKRCSSHELELLSLERRSPISRTPSVLGPIEEEDRDARAPTPSPWSLAPLNQRKPEYFHIPLRERSSDDSLAQMRPHRFLAGLTSEDVTAAQNRARQRLLGRDNVTIEDIQRRQEDAEKRQMEFRNRVVETARRSEQRRQRVIERQLMAAEERRNRFLAKHGKGKFLTREQRYERWKLNRRRNNRKNKGKGKASKCDLECPSPDGMGVCSDFPAASYLRNYSPMETLSDTGVSQSPSPDEMTHL